ncbi:hypothetical protein FOZ62_024612 [Perkinsus olseni]|uniref:Uncharacterized protein n=1 Tax=Perkinsus olseni TaxID=32597 RepID=A0A7J6RUA7_PEROL|nr:hypothetical protein FOZ62_024612 [Perkinsus olseni]
MAPRRRPQRPRCPSCFCFVVVNQPCRSRACEARRAREAADQAAAEAPPPPAPAVVDPPPPPVAPPPYPPPDYIPPPPPAPPPQHDAPPPPPPPPVAPPPTPPPVYGPPPPAVLPPVAPPPEPVAQPPPVVPVGPADRADVASEIRNQQNPPNPRDADSDSENDDASDNAPSDNDEEQDQPHPPRGGRNPAGNKFVKWQYVRIHPRVQLGIPQDNVAQPQLPEDNDANDDPLARLIEDQHAEEGSEGSAAEDGHPDFLLDGAFELDEPIAPENLPDDQDNIELPGTNAADVPVMVDDSTGVPGHILLNKHYGLLNRPGVCWRFHTASLPGRHALS